MPINSSELLSTRLFPKNQGASAVILTGLAARCDWVITSDWQPPIVELRRQKPCRTPSTIFLSLRQPFAALSFFAQEVLPCLAAPFILISGSEDVTLPLQCDQRWRPFTAAEDQLLLRIASHPLLLRWHAENLDWPFAPSLSPIPLGVLPSTADGSDQAELLSVSTTPAALQEREPLVLCANRQRPGPQWVGRKRLLASLQATGHPWLLLPSQELSAADFVALLRRCSFVICAAGGGWDPCPKLWHALLHGAVPIVRSSALDGVFSTLPVWIVRHWDQIDWSYESLLSQRNIFAERWPERAQLLEHLSLEYWWKSLQSDAMEPG